MASNYGIEQSIGPAILRSNVFEALTELGSIDAAARLIDPVTQGKPGRTNRMDYEARATLEMLRGNTEGAHKRWVDIRKMPSGSLGFQLWPGLREAEMYLWSDAPQVGFDQSHALLVQAAAGDRGLLSGELLAAAGPLLILALRACADLTEQARARRNVEAVDAARRHAEQLADLHRGMQPDPLAAGPLRPSAGADHASWHAEWSRLRGESDAELWEQAANAWAALTRPHRAAYARWRQAEAVLAHRGGRAEAAEVLRTAARQAEQHVPLSARIQDLARRARIDLSPRAPAVQPEQGATRQFGLTDRELAVLCLLADGKTNSEIGAALFISRKTASVHVTSILRKLAVATRVQAAAVAERAGLLSTDSPDLSAS